MAHGINILYKPPGPVAARFMASTKQVQAIEGPIGSGKTSSVLMKHIQLAARQRPSTRDGIRKYKFCVVRDTYRQLWKTTIPSWHKWMPQTVGKWVGSTDAPASHTIKFDMGTGIIELIAEFVAIGEHKVEDVLRGYEPTAFYLNEADLLQEEVFVYCRGRAGRYPMMSEGGPSWYGVLLDFNHPEEDSWIENTFIYDCPEEFDYFKQPPGMIEVSKGVYTPNPEAENLENLPKGYYDNQIVGQKRWYIKRMVLGKSAAPQDGDPVFEDEFDDDLHVAKAELQPIKGLPLILGSDAGRKPACIIGQKAPDGQWLILDEIVRTNMGAKRFGKTVSKVLASKKYRDFDVAEAWADPASAYKGDLDEYSWVDIVSDASGIDWHPAPGENNLSLRLEAVSTPLTELLSEGRPGLLISPTCKMLRRGFNSGYKFRKIVGTNRTDDTPAKNEYSHPHDGLQNLLLGGGEYDEIKRRENRKNKGRPRQTQAITEDNPTGSYAGQDGRQAYAISE